MGNADKSGLLGRTAIPLPPSIVNLPPMLALGSRESRKVTAISLLQQSRQARIGKHVSWNWHEWFIQVEALLGPAVP